MCPPPRRSARFAPRPSPLVLVLVLVLVLALALVLVLVRAVTVLPSCPAAPPVLVA